VTTPPAGDGPGQWPYGQPQPAPYAPPPQHREATKALVLGIVALAGGFTCYLPILVSPVAWVVGHRVVREIDSYPYPMSGRGEARAGMILGIIGTVILGLGVALLILVLAVVSSGA
jgi:hypothetical protein